MGCEIQSPGAFLCGYHTLFFFHFVIYKPIKEREGSIREGHWTSILGLRFPYMSLHKTHQSLHLRINSNIQSYDQQCPVVTQVIRWIQILLLKVLPELSMLTCSADTSSCLNLCVFCSMVVWLSIVIQNGGWRQCRMKRKASAL